MARFKVRIQKITTETFTYKAQGESLEAVQTTAEYNEPDPEHRTGWHQIKKVTVNQIKVKK